MGPAIVCVLFPLVFLRIYAAVRNPAPASLRESASEIFPDLEQALRFARIVMYVGLFWFFIQAWLEKAGYIANPFSNDEIDLPTEFGGTMLGFWIARYLTKPFSERSEVFRSTLFIDFFSSFVMGLLYTVVVSGLSENVTGSIAHSLYPAVAASLDVRGYTTLQQHMRPFELLVLAGVMWWILNRTLREEEIASLHSPYIEPEPDSLWYAPKTLAIGLGTAAACVLVWAVMFSLLEPYGLNWTTATSGTAMGVTGFLLVKRAQQAKLVALFGVNDDPPGE